jgi:dihydroflavonol-4-reductase
MKIAVTGASGHIGNNLCRMLIDRGHQVKAMVHRVAQGLTGLPLESIKGDVTSEPDLEELCHGCEVVFHLAAHISIRKTDPLCRSMNVDSCINLIKAAKSTGVKKIIHFSSIHAFRAQPLTGELNETRELTLNSPFSYDHSKALSQKIMMESSSRQLEIVVLNPTAVIGPNDFKPSLLGNALIRFYRGQNPVLVPGGYNWVDVRDVCTAAVNTIEKGIAGECYLLGGSWQSLGTLALEIEKHGGHKAPWLEIPVWMAQIGAPVINLQSLLTKHAPLYTFASLLTLSNSHRNISSAKAESILRFRPRPFTETISDTMAWFREHNYL